MNPLDWDTIRKLSTHHQNDVNNSMENASRTNKMWDTHCEPLRHTADETQTSRGVNVGWKGLVPPLNNFYMKDSEVEDPDGQPLVMDDEDPELARKRKELREIEERIMFKKASIALKTVEPFVKNTTPPDFYNQSATCKDASLKDRVNVILQQRHPPSFFSKVSNSLRDQMINYLQFTLRIQCFSVCGDQLLSQYYTVLPPRFFRSHPA